MNNTALVILTSSLAFSLSGCSIIFGDDSPFRDRSDDYLKSEAIEIMAVPAELDRQALGQLYPVPNTGSVPQYQLDDEFEVPRVMPNFNQTNTSGVKIQRLGEESWILASSAPSETWPRVRNYLAANGMPTEFANASTGTIDTAWVELNGVEDTVHQFRLRLEQGVQLDTTEIIIQQRQYPSNAIPASLPEWSGDGSDDFEQEEWMRTNLSQALASEDITSSASLLGQEIGAAVKVILETPADEDPYIVMRLSGNRAWASIGYALETDSFELLERDSDRRVADFEFYASAPQDISWFAALFGKRNPPPELYYLAMEEGETEGEQIVRVYNLDGSIPESRDSYRILNRLRENFT